MGAYPGDFADEIVAERSTPEHAATMVNSAARLTRAVVELVEDRLGESDACHEVRAELIRLAGQPAPKPDNGSRQRPCTGTRAEVDPG